MKIEQLELLIKSNTGEDGVINLEAINKSINEETDVLIEKKRAKAVDEAKQTIIDEFIKTEGFDNADAYKAYIKNSKAGATELSEKATRLEQELELVRKEANTYKSEAEGFKYTSKLIEKGIDPKFKDYAMFKINAMVNDTTDFDGALEAFIAESPYVVNADTQPITMRPPVKPINLPIEDEVTKAFRERNPNIKLD